MFRFLLAVFCCALIQAEAQAQLVAIQIKYPTGTGYCCGVHVGYRDGKAVIVTAGHSFRQQGWTAIHVGQGNNGWPQAQLIRWTGGGKILDQDCAVLLCDARGLGRPAKYADRDPYVGEQVVVDTIDGGRGGRETTTRTVRYSDRVHFSATGSVDRGESGSPVYTAGPERRLVGLISGSDGQTTVVVPIAAVSNFVAANGGTPSYTNDRPVQPASRIVASDADQVVLEAYGAPWCQPCLDMHSDLKALESEGVHIVWIDTDKDRNACRLANVAALPTVIVKRGATQLRLAGRQTQQQLRAAIASVYRTATQAPDCARPTTGPGPGVVPQTPAQEPETKAPPAEGAGLAPTAPELTAEQLAQLTILRTRIDGLESRMLNIASRSVPGPAGPQGPAGLDGKPGERGPAGPAGPPADLSAMLAEVARLRNEFQTLQQKFAGLSGELQILVSPELLKEQ